jgi:hypothetical protein
VILDWRWFSLGKAYVSYQCLAHRVPIYIFNPTCQTIYHESKHPPNSSSRALHTYLLHSLSSFHAFNLQPPHPEIKAATSHIANCKKKSQDGLVTLDGIFVCQSRVQTFEPDRRVLVSISGSVQTAPLGVPACIGTVSARHKLSHQISEVHTNAAP